MEHCEIVAELGSCHQGDLGIALKMVEECAKAGVDAVKLQKRSNRTLYTRSFFESPYNSENAFGRTYGEHREFLEFGRPEYETIRDAAKERGLRFYATAFDEPSVDFLLEVGVDAIKIASGDLTNIPLLGYASSTLLPLYVSTGGGTMDDVERVVDAIGTYDVTLLQCTASYPCDFSELDLGVIGLYKRFFPDLRVGASLHDNGIWSAVAAYVLGARSIEKHMTLGRAMKGTDHSFALEPQGLGKLVRDLRRAEVAMGGQKRLHDSELGPIRKMSKSLYASRPLRAETILGVDDIVIRSPGEGLPPYELDAVLGHRLVKDLSTEEPITEAHLDLAEGTHRAVRAEGLGA